MTVQPYIPGIEGLHSKVERTIAKRLIRTILEAGYDVRIHEGEDWAMDKRSNDPKTIFDNMASTDEDRVYFYSTSERKEQLGWIWLIYGNGEDLISDYSDNELTNDLVAKAEKWDS